MSPTLTAAAIGAGAGAGAGAGGGAAFLQAMPANSARASAVERAVFLPCMVSSLRGEGLAGGELLGGGVGFGNAQLLAGVDEIGVLDLVLVGLEDARPQACLAVLALGDLRQAVARHDRVGAGLDHRRCGGLRRGRRRRGPSLDVREIRFGLWFVVGTEDTHDLPPFFPARRIRTCPPVYRARLLPDTAAAGHPCATSDLSGALFACWSANVMPEKASPARLGRYEIE